MRNYVAKYAYRYNKGTVQRNRKRDSEPYIERTGNMTDQEIREYYDTCLNMTLSELSLLTGKSVQELKRILMS